MLSLPLSDKSSPGFWFQNSGLESRPPGSLEHACCVRSPNDAYGLVSLQMGPAAGTLTVLSVRNAPSSPDSGSSAENPVSSTKTVVSAPQCLQVVDVGRRRSTVHTVPNVDKVVESLDARRLSMVYA